MTTFQKTIKYIAMGFAIFLAVSIIGGILSMFGLFGRFFDDDMVTEDVKAYTVSGDISALEIKINAADFTIKQGDAFSVESNLKYLTVDNENGVLTIREARRFSHTYNGATLTLYIPENTVFKSASIATGAGRFTVDDLNAGTINLELGAGEVNIGTLIAKSSAGIEGGAGKITISNGALNNLDLDMGVGQLNLVSALTGESEFNLGIGESNITVIGNKSDFKLDIEKGLGNITVDGTSISNVKDFGNGSYSIDINGGIGAINLNFQEPISK